MLKSSSDYGKMKVVIDVKTEKFEMLGFGKITDEKFDRFYELLESSLPRVEFRDKCRQKNLLNIKVYEMLFCSVDEKCIGALAFWHLDDTIFVEHFVVDESYRGKGIGTKMLNALKEQTKSNVILEVELPYNEMNKRRIAFYERNGFCYNDFEYYQVPLNKGDEPLPLRIMSYPKSISLQEFESIREKLKKAVYQS